MSIGPFSVPLTSTILSTRPPAAKMLRPFGPQGKLLRRVKHYWYAAVLRAPERGEPLHAAVLIFLCCDASC